MPLYADWPPSPSFTTRPELRVPTTSQPQTPRRETPSAKPSPKAQPKTR
jgi:hypothetical protein